MEYSKWIKLRIACTSTPTTSAVSLTKLASEHIFPACCCQWNLFALSCFCVFGRRHEIRCHTQLQGPDERILPNTTIHSFSIKMKDRVRGGKIAFFFPWPRCEDPPPPRVWLMPFWSKGSHTPIYMSQTNMNRIVMGMAVSLWSSLCWCCQSPLPHTSNSQPLPSI